MVLEDSIEAVEMGRFVGEEEGGLEVELEVETLGVEVEVSLSESESSSQATSSSVAVAPGFVSVDLFDD